jgi:NADH dehydrogenase/NADH:ubiquinone oxidoreductase subunit G
MEYDRELFGEISRFVEIQVDDETFKVPDQLELLRVFQFLNFSIDYARLCWNASCQRCFIEYEKNSKNIKALSCRTKSFEGMKIKSLPEAVRKDPSPI